MLHRRTLRSRITWAFSLFGLGLSGVLAFGWFFTMMALEEGLIYDTLEAELQYFVSQNKDKPPQEHFASSTTVIHVVPIGSYEHLPVELNALVPGAYHIGVNSRDYRTLVRDVAGYRYFVLYDDTTMVQGQGILALVLVLSIILATGLSTWIGYYMSTQIISPVVRLASEIGTSNFETSEEVKLGDYSDDELGMLAGKFREYRARLQELLDREKEFAGNVSHELRTPLTNINLAVEVLSNDPSISDQSKQRLNRIRRAGREMSELVSAFLVLAQAEATNTAEIDDCDVNAVVRQVMEDQKIWLGDKGVETHLDEKAQLRVRAPSRVVSVLVSNLVRNAYRYTSSGEVRVSVDISGVTVEDSGPGIDPEIQNDLFGRHFRGHAKGGDGIGIGLSIVRRICERYGWSVQFKTEAGQGTRFDIKF